MVSSANMIHLCLLSFVHNLFPLAKNPLLSPCPPRVCPDFKTQLKACLFHEAAEDGDVPSSLFMCSSHVNSGCRVMWSPLPARWTRLLAPTRTTESELRNLQITCFSSESSARFCWETLFQCTQSYIMSMEFQLLPGFIFT